MKVITNKSNYYDVIKVTSKDEWLNNRGIGGSSAGVILGYNHYKSKAELYDEIIAVIDKGVHGEGISNEFTEYGQKAEPLLRSLFALDHKDEYEVIDPPSDIEIYRSKNYPFMTATLDGELRTKNGDLGFYEGKTCNIMNKLQEREWIDKIPDSYYCQIIHYFAVTNYSFAVLHAQLKYVRLREDGSTSVFCKRKEYLFKREDCKEDIEILINAEKDFYENNILKRVRPDISIVTDL